MKKTLLLLFAGFLPLLVGFLQNYLMVQLQIAFPYFLLGLLMMSAWALLSKTLHDPAAARWKTPVLLNLPGFLFLVLAIIQELVLTSYWPGFFGLAPQFFFLPMLSLSFSLTMNFFTTMPPAYFLSFLLMVTATLLGCKLKNGVQPPPED